jgi:hypothetical protein
MSNIDTTEYDQFRQGIYARGHYSRRGITPVLGPALTSSIIVQTTFGQPKTFSDGTPFDDLGKFQAAVYLEDSGSMYPAIIGNIDIADPDQADGAIEPFTIRSIVAFTSTEFPYPAKGIKADFAAGNTDPLLKSDQIVSEFPFTNAPTIDPFIDADDRMGSTISSAVKIPGLFPDEEKTIPPFHDEKTRVEVFEQIPTGQDMLNALNAMTGSATSNYMPNDHRSAGKGFTFPHSRLGVDSIAFGGFRRG